MPIFLREYGPAVAFGIPGVLMFIATFIFWLGRKQYVNVPPAAADPDSFLHVARTALLSQSPGQGRPGLVVAAIGGVLAVGALLLIPKLGFVICACMALGLIIAFGGMGTSMQLDRARGKHPQAAVDGVRAVLRMLIVFALSTPFWSLVDQ
jgi:POT family proton-dependent oligopeptide transporter